ncbi:DUF2268 domain-containing protein [Solimonas sp. C16B3]|uniref:DUF2268 domain-containing protein n=2 Tax=Solimonas marina TaxID=2714601 RepID=A0A969WA15_9GAMM|nr:DUF2268 domain-containing protein [Solimonas marina]
MAATPLPSSTPRQPDVRIDDVTRFYAVFDQAQGKPSAAALQSGYLTPGSIGLQQFVQARIGSAQKLADAIAKSPQDFRHARQCMAALPAVRTRLRPVFARLAQLDPRASFPPVTVVIGRNTTGGTTTAEGVTIGLEVICRANWLDPDIVERLVHLIAHEYVHVQQPAAQVDPPADASLLFQSLLEGGAEFIGELTSGAVANSHLQRWTQGKACEIERDFAAQAMGTDTSAWLYNGPGTPEHPGDLGYWVGYRIVRADYLHASNPRQAIQDILHITTTNAVEFLQRSGWRAEEDCRQLDAQPASTSSAGASS